MACINKHIDIAYLNKTAHIVILKLLIYDQITYMEAEIVYPFQQHFYIALYRK